MFNALEFFKDVYSKFGFQFDIGLSTRPEKFIGKIETWDQAEAVLKIVLDESGLKWNLNPADGAFYGPKIDIHLTDSLNRKHQCATIQLDFQLPSEERFDLTYIDENQRLQRPVIIHRAIYGSFERFISILCEHYAGKWPFWLSPNQVIVIPVSEKFLNYAKEVQNNLKLFKYYVDVDSTDNTLQKKIREAQLHQYNYILVVGQKEIDNNNLTVRYRDTGKIKVMNISDLLSEMKLQKKLIFYLFNC